MQQRVLRTHSVLAEISITTVMGAVVSKNHDPMLVSHGRLLRTSYPLNVCCTHIVVVIGDGVHGIRLAA